MCFQESAPYRPELQDLHCKPALECQYEALLLFVSRSISWFHYYPLTQCCHRLSIPQSKKYLMPLAVRSHMMHAVSANLLKSRCLLLQELGRSAIDGLPPLPQSLIRTHRYPVTLGVLPVAPGALFRSSTRIYPGCRGASVLLVPPS